MMQRGAIRQLTAAQSCAESEWCSSSQVDISKLSTSQQNTWRNNQGQWINSVTLYKAGKINIDNATLAAYIEDAMGFSLGFLGKITARFGLRLDYDTYMNKAPIAPRFSLNYVAPWNKWEFGHNFATMLNLGVNRYYGRNLFTYALMDGRSSLQSTLTRANPGILWENATATQNKNDTNFDQLRVPYSDEFMAGISQNLFVFNINAKYIRRNGRDEIRRMCSAPDGSLSSPNCASNSTLTSDLRVYTNEGRSDTDVVTLSIQNNTPINIWRVKNYFLFAFDWTNVKRNYEDYSTDLTSGELNNEWISWNGQLIRYADRPATNFVRPHTIRLTTTHAFNIWRTKWLWNNFFRIRSNYTTMANTNNANRDSFVIDGVLTPVATFRPFDIKTAFTWDMRVGFEVDVWRKNTLFVNFDIFNVLDNRNMAIYNFSGTIGNNNFAATPIYEVGRQFWVEVGYKL
ncbi:hypothetical protein BA723_02265 [Helicobacter sp. CLO-3]|nr:hypothetical protein BA723_02265 [Helicobacter sp. CLO-3]